MDHERAAQNCRQFLGDAVGDIANDMLSPSSGMLNDKYGKKIARAKKNRCQDIAGWLADELYNDPDMLEDFLGDRICDETHGNEEDFQKVLSLVEQSGHAALKTACRHIRERHTSNK